ncbi:hypothetical protein DSECCO2_395980 [anaerobic digester metagenome]
MQKKTARECRAVFQSIINYSFPPAHHTLSNMVQEGTFAELEETSLKAQGNLQMNPTVALLGFFISGNPVRR